MNPPAKAHRIIDESRAARFVLVDFRQRFFKELFDPGVQFHSTRQHACTKRLANSGAIPHAFEIELGGEVGTYSGKRRGKSDARAQFLRPVETWNQRTLNSATLTNPAAKIVLILEANTQLSFAACADSIVIYIAI